MGYTIALSLFVVLVALIVVAVKASYEVAHFQNDRDPDRYVVSRAYYDSLQKEPVVLYPMGYAVSGELALCSNSRKAVVLVHGITASRRTICDYAELFHKAGYHVLLVDLPSHGESGGDHRSLGFYEKRVVLACMNYLRGRLGALVEIGLWGVSMGGATVLLAAAAGADCRFVIADCAYEDLSLVLAGTVLRSRSGNPLRIPICCARLITAAPSLATKLRYGWRYSDCAPIDCIDRIHVPVLFIHGLNDTFVTARNSIDMHKKRLSYGLPSRLELFEAKHAESFHSDPARYGAVVRDFLSSL